MSLDTPFRLGPFIVDQHGRMEPGDPGHFPVFNLSWRGVQVRAHLDPGDPAGASGRLAFSTIVGRVPSTAGGGTAAGNAARRAEAFELVRGLMRVVAAEWRVSLLADHRIAVEARRELALPASAVDLLTQVTCFLLDLAPYLDLLDEVELTGDPSPAPAPGDGTRKT